MKLLEEVTGFPAAARETLARSYGIESAEAFYMHTMRSRDGMEKALKISPDELDGLVRVVEGYLSPKYIEQCRKTPAKHARGVILD